MEGHSCPAHRLLERHGLEHPDGRPLYAYRLNDSGFVELKAWLRDRLAAYRNNLATLSERDCGLFVLYAAEWWRRTYDGGRWKWDPVLEEIGLSTTDWTQSAKKHCVETGLRYWRIGSTGSGGLRFIGVIARQGGLPVALIAEARGRIGQLLGQVLRLAGPDSPRRSLRAWIDSLQDRLPASYQREETLDLLTDLAEAVLRLANEARVTSSQGAIALLDERVPAWRDRLPLRVEDEHAQSLIEQWVGDAVQRPATANLNEARIQRWLEPGNDISWSLRSRLDLPDRFTNADLGRVFEVPDTVPLGHSPTLSLIAAERSLEWSLQRLAGHSAYRIPTQTRDYSGATAAAMHKLQLRGQNGDCFEASIRGGDALDPDLPWVFEEPHDGTQTLLRTGGGGVPTETALLALPEGWTVACDGSQLSAAELIAYLEAPLREIHRVRGTVVIESPNQDRWRLRTAQVAAEAADYHWQGRRCWLDLDSSALAFYGRPRLYEGERRIPEHELEWRPAAASGHLGPMIVTHRMAGEILHRTRLLVLPEAARIEIAPEDADRGTIRLHAWDLASVRLLEPADVLTLNHHTDGRDSILCVAFQHSANPCRAPAEVRIELAWPGNPAPARLRLPFPGKGARAYDGSGRSLENETWLALDQLAGSRVIAIGLRGRPRLRFEARRPHEPLRPAAHDECALSSMADGRIEIRLQDHAERIRALLATTDLIDGWVQLCLDDHFGQTVFTLRVSRYVARLQSVGTQVALRQSDLARFSAPDLECIALRALPLESPGDEAEDLQSCRSESVATGAWDFDPARREPGAWLIYAAPDSPLPLRPMLIPVGPQEARVAAGDYARAIGLVEREEREAALDNLLVAMARDFTHPGWNEFERLASQVGHLPLVALDGWRRLARSPRAVAALALRLGRWPDGFIDRFARELPFDWILVSYGAWRDAVRCLEAQCEEWFGSEHGRGELERQFDEAKAMFLADWPALGKLFGILRSESLDQPCKEITFMRTPHADDHFHSQLFVGDDAEVQRLLRAHAADENWPNIQEIYDLIDHHRRENGRGAGLLSDEYKDFRHGVVNLPILLALRCALGIDDDAFSNPARVHDLRLYRTFDPDWFDTAFDLTIGRCLSRDLLEC